MLGRDCLNLVALCFRWIDQGGGVFKRYFRSGDGVWRDASNLSTSIVNPITPGKAVYYFHYGTGSLSINF